MSEMLYLECNSGISGDMLTAALLDLGAEQEVLERAVDSLPLPGFDLQISRVKKAGLDACDFAVLLDSVHENHDHDMKYLHGFGKDAENPVMPPAGHRYVSHEHRGPEEIRNMIAEGDLTEHAKELALKIFRILAEAEAKAHGVPLEEVHFHEVGAVDSIVDVVSAAVCLDNLGIYEVVIPCLSEGRGSVRCRHGILPIPVPAVANIIQAHQIPLHIMDMQGEFVTPTGAAAAAAIRTAGVLPEQFVIKKIGVGAGKRMYERPSLLRAILIEEI